MARNHDGSGLRESDMVGGVAAAPAARPGPLRRPHHRQQQLDEDEGGAGEGVRGHCRLDEGLEADLELIMFKGRRAEGD